MLPNRVVGLTLRVASLSRDVLRQSHSRQTARALERWLVCYLLRCLLQLGACDVCACVYEAGVFVRTGLGGAPAGVG